ncbi:hypothetical protein L3X38_040955 [Prunus dulcis]|uniref:Uncharacterized protein n=1 Tax=Prunus dulcis TaxID=3755 RepID=A0AAD4YIA6_PRUDU|nr:hypothetical protein L3X38_040955 [Prunus dulcis]
MKLSSYKAPVWNGSRKVIAIQNSSISVQTVEENEIQFMGCGSTQEVLNSIEHRVSVSMNNTLNADFTYEEVKRALFHMHPTKALVPDEMPPLFFQKFWHIVGNDVNCFKNDDEPTEEYPAFYYFPNP